MQIKGSFDINASRDQVWQKIKDPALMAGCIPGCENIEEIDSTHYLAVVALGIGVIRARFELKIEILDEQPPTEVRSRTSGQEDSRASQLTAENIVKLIELDPENTRVNYYSDITLSGRLGKFGMGVMGKYVQGVGDEFADNFRSSIAGQAPSPVDAPHSKTSRMTRLLNFIGVKTKPASIQPSDREVVDPTNRANSSPVVINNSLALPESLDEAITLFHQQSDAFILAGGATLIAMKNAGLVQVGKYISLERVQELQGISQLEDGTIRVGSMTRHCVTAESELLKESLHVVRQAAQSIANVPVRNMGTIGGSLANADPAADYLAALVCVDAKIEIVGPDGKRVTPIKDFLVDWYETILSHGDIISAILLPPAGPGHSMYRKVARVSGDFAIASCAISLKESSQDAVAQIAIGGCGPAPLRDRDAEVQLHKAGYNAESIVEFSRKLVALSDPIDDVRGSSEYRRNLIPRLIKDGLAQVFDEVTA